MFLMYDQEHQIRMYLNTHRRENSVTKTTPKPAVISAGLSLFLIPLRLFRIIIMFVDKHSMFQITFNKNWRWLPILFLLLWVYIFHDSNNWSSQMFWKFIFYLWRSLSNRILDRL